MKVDIHVHTNKYSNCGVSSPEEMVQAAMACGLDAIVLTEHDYMWGPEELADLQARFPGIKLFSGIEVSIDSAEHIVVIGVPHPQLFSPFMKPADLVAAVRQHQGAAILAHPYRWSPSVRQDILDARLDAIEIFSNSIRNYMQQPIRGLQQKLDLPLVACSDGHHTQHLGLYALDLHQPAKDDKGLARMIRQGEFTNWSSPERIDEMNAEIIAKASKLPDLIEAGMPVKDALSKVGLRRNLAYAIEHGLDLLFPTE
ncbi:MAG: PHP domain-containing protein [Bacillota bacterium]